MSTFLALVVAVLVASQVSLAQSDTTGRWARIDIAVEGPLPRLPFQQQGARPEVHFASPEIGYAMIPLVLTNRGGDVIVTQDFEIAVTRDGGASWQLGDAETPRPWKMLGSFGIASNGYTTSDGGATWQHLAVRSDLSEIVSIDAASPAHIAIVYRATSAPSVNRLAYTTNGGSSWLFVDVLAADSSGALGIDHQTLLGRFPGEPRARWGPELRFVDTAALVIVSSSGAMRSERSYATWIDPGAVRAEWRLIPASSRLQFVDRQVGYVVGRGNLGPDNSGQILYGTTDGGHGWDSLAGSSRDHIGMSPDETPRFESVVMLSKIHGVTADAYTIDGGRTWHTRADHPFGIARFKVELFPSGSGYYTAIEILDSLHRFVVGPWGLFARSSDAGTSWTRSAAAGNAHAVIARGELLLVAREYQSLARSSDAGRTWRDIGLTGGLPRGLRQIHAMSFLSAADSLHLFAIADFVAIDSAAHFGVIESTDGGLTWKEISGLPAGEGFVVYREGPNSFRDLGITFADDSAGNPVGFLTTPVGLLVSEDLGRTWTGRWKHPYPVIISMADADHGVAYGRNDHEAYDYGFFVTSDRFRTWRTYPASDLPSTRTGGSGPVFVHAAGAGAYSLYGIDNLSPQPPQTRVRSTTDGGETWTMTTHPTLAPYRIDREHYHQLTIADSIAYVVSGHLAIGRAPVGSAEFALVRGMDSSDPDLIVGRSHLHVPVARLSESGRYLYIAGRNDAVARWTIGALQPPPPPPPPPAGVLIDSPGTLAVSVGDDAIVVRLPQPASPARLALYDPLGSLVASMALKGTDLVRLDVGGLAAGAYLLHIDADGRSTTARVILAR